MTEKELAAKFTPPDRNLALVRSILIRRMEMQTVHYNKVAREETTSARIHAARVQAESFSRAARMIRDLIDRDGKVLLEDIADEMKEASYEGQD